MHGRAAGRAAGCGAATPKLPHARRARSAKADESQPDPEPRMPVHAGCEERRILAPQPEPCLRGRALALHRPLPADGPEPPRTRTCCRACTAP